MNLEWSIELVWISCISRIVVQLHDKPICEHRVTGVHQFRTDFVEDTANGLCVHDFENWIQSPVICVLVMPSGLVAVNPGDPDIDTSSWSCIDRRRFVRRRPNARAFPGLWWHELVELVYYINILNRTIQIVRDVHEQYEIVRATEPGRLGEQGVINACSGVLHKGDSYPIPSQSVIRHNKKTGPFRNHPHPVRLEQGGPRSTDRGTTQPPSCVVPWETSMVMGGTHVDRRRHTPLRYRQH